SGRRPMPARALGEKRTRSPLRSVWPRPRSKPLARMARRTGSLGRPREPRVAWHSSSRKEGRGWGEGMRRVRLMGAKLAVRAGWGQRRLRSCRQRVLPDWILVEWREREGVKAKAEKQWEWRIQRASRAR